MTENATARTYKIANPAGTFNYQFNSDRSQLRDYAESFKSFVGGVMIFPIPYGVRGILQGISDQPARFIVADEAYDVGPSMIDGTIVEAVLTDSQMSGGPNEDTTAIIQRGLEAGELVNPLWYATDVLAVSKVDTSKLGTRDRLAYLKRSPPLFNFLSYANDLTDKKSWADDIDSVLSSAGISEALIKGVNATYEDVQYVLRASVMIDLRIFRNGTLVEGRPEVYGRGDLPWRVIGVPSDIKNSAIVTCRVRAPNRAEYSEPSASLSASSKGQIARRMERGGLLPMPDGQLYPFVELATAVGIS